MRIDRAREKLSSLGKLPFLCTNLVNIRYLTGFSGSNGYLVIGDTESFLITDSRYEEYAKNILADTITILMQKDSPFDSIRSAFEALKAETLFVEENSIHYSFYCKLAENIGSLEKGGDVIDRMRMVKDSEELSIIKKAARIADECTTFVAETASDKMTEWELSAAIENFYRSHGCRKSSFDSIVSSGAGSSMPHYVPSMTKKIETGAPLMIDMGCLYEDYNSDLTRTFFIGTVSAEFESLYDTALTAQMMAVDAVQAGMTTGQLDSVARDYISQKGFGDYFGHSLGHGIGLQVHELPAVKRSGDITLEPGMVITIEPGIYLPHKGGVRIEDMVCVTEDGCEVLTHYTKKLTIL
jgi:Xaa-Pro aminopeptidase